MNPLRMNGYAGKKAVDLDCPPGDSVTVKLFERDCATKTNGALLRERPMDSGIRLSEEELRFFH